ncbi:hypothetical protein GH714_028690 [Hevea brasiliensis]|uniref:Glycosyltransferase 61 catalytic domain-containing protein n=1 Tax=Hevea brasiliensis TaxID=3981 RepID=A0A6A6NJM2_HEVBR|nr:hypothetical protein GH714_028690 [Hevea brasiliensis]
MQLVILPTIFLSLLSYLFYFIIVLFAEKPRAKLRTITRQGPQFRLGGQISCDRSQLRYDLCSVNGSTVMDPTTSTFFLVGPANPNSVEKIKPYPRKFDDFIMTQIKELTLTLSPTSPPCEIQHSAPALVFSVGGYTGNFFHDFNDGIIPLFITVNTIFPDQDFVIVISEAPSWWITKYVDLLNTFTTHPILTLNDTTSTHCFPSAEFGLISHGFMTINQTLMPNQRTFLHFRALLEKAYSQNVLNPPTPNVESRPRLLLASRKGSKGREIVNEDEVIEAMEEIGFEVIVFAPKDNTSLVESYALIKSSHALVGVHGAALTHSLFLRARAVFVQVVPIGIEWASDAFFGRVGRGLDLEYMEYRIGVEESSLVEKYGRDSLLLKDPHGVQVQGKGWPPEIMNIYLMEQNVKLDLGRFREFLKKPYSKAKQFMDRHG